MRTRSISITAATLAVLALAGAGGAIRSQAAGGAAVVTGPPVALAGSALPEVSGATPIGRPAASTQLHTVVFLRPRNGWLLKHVAARRTHRRSLSGPTMRRLFVPPRAQIAAVEGYLRVSGLRVTGQHLLAVSATGTVAAQERAFGVQLRLYRRHGHEFRAPSGPTRLPAGIAGDVQAVGGLDNALRLQSNAVRVRGSGAHAVSKRGRRHAGPGAVTACAAAQNTKSAFPGSLLPADLAGANGYDIDSLGTDGTNESIALLEFSSYSSLDVSTYTSCFGIATAPQNKVVASGVSMVDNLEVTLDIEVAMATAPNAHIYVYEAPNDVSEGIAAINQMVSDQASTGVHVVSDSWGLCEPLMPSSLLEAENNALEAAAAAGMSFYVASGDDGSSGCLQSTGSKDLYTDDPSSQPFATAVGGTRLKTTSPRSETTWNDQYGGSGGGVSMWWPAPGYQSAVTQDYGSGKCGYPGTDCRQTPDISLDGDPATGYVVRSDGKWGVVGGTSGAAPLMAGITADANEYSLAHNGSRLGFANPFLYAEHLSTPSVFHDIVGGNNNTVGGASHLYPASAGFDLATGLGSVDANVFASQLAADGSPAVTTPDTTAFALSTPVAGKTITYGQTITFSGTLTDTTSSTPLANTPVYLVTSIGTARTVTNGSGQYSLPLSTALTRSLSWSMAFLGSDTEQPAQSSRQAVYIIPHLTVAAELPVSSGHYVAHRNVYFTATGSSRPNMHGASVAIEYRQAGATTWHTLTHATVGAGAGYSARIRFATKQTVYLRWAFVGGHTHHWQSAVSPQSRAVVVS